MAGLYAPLPTLRSHPRGGLRTDRGRRGLLLLHRSGLSPHTPCRSPGALTRVAACTLARATNSAPPFEASRHSLSPILVPIVCPVLPRGGGTRRVGLAPNEKPPFVPAHADSSRSCEHVRPAQVDPQ